MDRSRNRIPAAEVEIYDSWSLDDIDNGHVIAVVHTEGRKGEAGAGNTQQKTEPMTAEELENISQQAYQEGYDEGNEKGQKEGYQAGLQSAQIEIDQRLGQLQQVIDLLQQKVLEQDQNLEVTLLKIIAEISEKVIHRELTDNNLPTIRHVINDVVDALPVGVGKISIYLSCADLEAMNQLEDLNPDWQLLEDTELAIGGCRVESASSLVDFTLQSRFQEIIAQLNERTDNIDVSL